MTDVFTRENQIETLRGGVVFYGILITPNKRCPVNAPHISEVVEDEEARFYDPAVAAKCFLPELFMDETAAQRGTELYGRLNRLGVNRMTARVVRLRLQLLEE